MGASKDQVAQLIVSEAKARGHTREECLGELSALYQESQWDETIWDSTHVTYGVAQQDGSYPNRFDGAAAQVKAFFDKLDVKRTSAGHGDIWLNICWLQQAPNWPSAQYWWDHGRQAYLTEIKSRIATVTPYLDKYWPVTATPAPATRTSYGMPTGTNSGGYGGSGAKFPDWVYQLGNAFGVKPSTYPGHQETDRVEAGYARNPQHLNRGIDWAAPGTADEVDRMQRFADYLFSIRGELEQLIWENPNTNKRLGVAGGKDVTTTSYYDYDGGYNKHRNHAHTRQDHSLPIPGGTQPAPAPPPAATQPAGPQFEQIDMFGKGGSTRSRQPINFFIHTEEGNGTAKSLAEYCQGQNGVSYHFTLRDRIVYYVVPTNLYSWSVLAANVFSVNLCFAGSKASWSRAEWLQREADIEIAAFIAVREARHFSFSTEVLTPQAGHTGSDVYPGEARPGISDHNYVTRELGIGNHTDVGPNFPWDVFTRYVNKYANTTTAPPTTGDDDLSAEAERMIKEMYTEYRKEKESPSRSFLATDGALVDSPLGILWNIDGNVWSQELTWAYLFDVPLAIDIVTSVAKNGSYEGSWVKSNEINAWLNEFGQAYCQGLINFKNALAAKLTSKTQASVVNDAAPVAATLDTAEYYRELTTLNKEIGGLRVELSQLQDENSRLQATAANTPAATVELTSAQAGSTGEQIGKAYDALESLRLADALPIEGRAPLAALIGVLQTKNGSKL